MYLPTEPIGHLFAAQIIALVGTGLATVALGFWPINCRPLSGCGAGTALAIKMVAYVVVAPIASAFAEQLPRRAMLVGLTWYARRSLSCYRSSPRSGRSTS